MNCKLRLALALMCVAGAGGLLIAEARGRGDAAEKSARIARGGYLVAAIGCADCHAPKRMTERGPEPDPALGLSGHHAAAPLGAAPAPSGSWIVATTGELTAWNGPWGTSFARNLTPDAETGIGSWTEEEFIATIRTGRTRGRGRSLLPPMPVAVYGNLSDEDLGSIFAWLQTQPAIPNHVPEPLPPTGAQ